MNLREINEIIKESIRVNKQMLDVLFFSNTECLKIEKSILDILRKQDTNTQFKTLAEIINPLSRQAQTWDKQVFSDMLHLLEFKKIGIERHNSKLQKLLKERRYLKLMIGYANRLQQNRGLGNSYHWYARNNVNNISYKIRTNEFISFGFEKDKLIEKK